MSDVDLAMLDQKLSALLVIALDRYIRETGVAKPNPRSVDKMLHDVGIKSKDIAALLGKTERAVNLMLAGDTNNKTKKGAKS